MLPVYQCFDYWLRSLIRFALICLAITLGACSALIEPDKSILTDLPCAAPCWQGITPGVVMTTERMIQILRTLPNVEEPWTPRGDIIAWYWKQPPWRKTAFNAVSLVGGKVHDIELSIDFELTVRDVLNKYGPPEAVNVVKAGLPEDPYIGMNLFYPTRGLDFKAKIVPWDAPVLEQATKVFEVTYMVPSESLESWQKSVGDVGLQPWPGYGKLDLSTSLPK